MLESYSTTDTKTLKQPLLHHIRLAHASVETERECIHHFEILIALAVETESGRFRKLPHKNLEISKQPKLLTQNEQFRFLYCLIQENGPSNCYITKAN